MLACLAVHWVWAVSRLPLRDCDLIAIAEYGRGNPLEVSGAGGDRSGRVAMRFRDTVNAQAEVCRVRFVRRYRFVAGDGIGAGRRRSARCRLLPLFLGRRPTMELSTVRRWHGICVRITTSCG